MIQLQGKFQKDITVAYSGGLDSAVALDFLARKHNVHMLYINHGDEVAKQEEHMAYIASKMYGLRLSVVYVEPFEQGCGLSREEYWRNKRYEIFHNVNEPVITAHHLDDCVETYVMNMLHGRMSTIPYRNKNVIRPFRLNRKSEFSYWASKHSVSYVEDPTNADITYAMRNRIRHEILPVMLKANPGLYTTIRNMMLKEKIND